MEHHPFDHLLKASWQAGVLIVLVLAAQWVFRRRLSPRWRYSLWLLVVIRLALPWTMASPASLFNLLKFGSSSLASGPGPSGLFGSAATRSSAVEANGQVEEPAFTPAAAVPAPGFSFSWLAGVWLAGATALTVFLLTSHYRVSRRVAMRRPLVETSEVGSPALFGFIRPRLLLPTGLTRNFSLEELRYIFLHELAHIKRRDILVGWMMTGLQIAHWFNPLVWVAFHRMRVDRELACDALALSSVGEGENQAYGQTIIKLLESFGRSAWAPSLAGTVENRNQIKERIRMIGRFNKTNRGWALAAALFAGFGLITFTDAESPASQSNKDAMGTWILVGKPGDVGLVPAEGGRLKSLTDTHWSMTQTDPKDGVVIFHHGGTYTLQGNDYVEHVEFANPSTKDRIGKTSKFKIKIEGDTLTLTGIGNPWNEVWKRAAPARPHKIETASLQGAWSGHENDESSQSSPSLLIKGSKFEFHGADTNEWYKATFSVYDTNPKQLVGIITECPFPQYVGRTTYAIYELQEGVLKIAGNEPGNPMVPASFEAASARKFVFRRKGND